MAVLFEKTKINGVELKNRIIMFLALLFFGGSFIPVDLLFFKGF